MWIYLDLPGSPGGGFILSRMREWHKGTSDCKVKDSSGRAIAVWGMLSLEEVLYGHHFHETWKLGQSFSSRYAITVDLLVTREGVNLTEFTMIL